MKKLSLLMVMIVLLTFSVNFADDKPLALVGSSLKDGFSLTYFILAMLILAGAFLYYKKKEK